MFWKKVSRVKEIHLKGLDEVVYEDVCENGLKMYIWVNKRINTFKASLIFKVGAENTSFKLGKNDYTVPFGTAHYLEHILCKNSDGSSLLGRFDQFGCYSNAATYADKTAYEFVGSENFFPCLELLLDAIQEKEFNQEYFEAERGPILEEARMRKDDANRLNYFGVNNILFHNYPNRISGLGRMEDIKSIKLEDLETLYRTFYHPENTILVVTGNVSPLEVAEFVKENQKKKTFPKWNKPKLPNYREPHSVVKRYEEVFANAQIPKVTVAVKVPLNDLSKTNMVLLLDILGLVLVSNFGSTSYFREELIAKKMVVSLQTSVEWERKYIILKVMAKTKYPKEVVTVLEEKMRHLEILEDDIFRKIKSEIANLVLSYEDPEYVNDLLAYVLVKYGKIVSNEKEILESITLEDIQKVMNSISFDEMSTFVIYSLKKDD